MLKKNSLAEASLEAKKHYSRDLQEQKLQLQKELDRSKAKVWRKPVSCLLSLVRGPGLFCSKPERGTDPFLGGLCNPGWFSVRLAVMRGLGGNSTAAFGACLFALLEVTVEDCAKVVFVH